MTPTCNMQFPLVKSRKAFVALCVIALFGSGSLRAQELPVLDLIRKAWAAREAAMPELTAEWIVDDGGAYVGPVPPNAPLDLQPAPRHETLHLRGSQLRYEHSVRTYGEDGGPRGSMQWQTHFIFESYAPEQGWRTIAGTSLESILPMVTINKSPDLASLCFDGRGLFLFWLRGLHDEYTATPFANWTVCTDPVFMSQNPDHLVLIQGVDYLYTLTVDPTMEFLPVRATRGRRPPQGEPPRTYSEFSVNWVADGSLVTGIRPATWTHQRLHNGRAGRPVIYELSHLRLSCDIQPGEFRVEFPAGREPSDESKTTIASTIRAQHATADKSQTTSQKHGIHWGYWSACAFLGLLLVALILKVRGSRGLDSSGGHLP